MSRKWYTKDSIKLRDIFDLVEKVKANSSESTFKFGIGIIYTALYHIEVRTLSVDETVIIDFDVVENDWKFLGCKQTMKKWNWTINTV